jgi:tetratricopeptide (TPR) repeat protein
VAAVVQAIGTPEAEAAHGDHAARALAEIGRLASEAGQARAADEALVAALLVRPRWADVLFQRACVLLPLGHRQEARVLLDAALALNPKYTAARLERALLDARDGLLGEALESLRSLSRAGAVEEPRVFQQGMQSLERADWEEATERLRQAFHVGDADLSRTLTQVHAHLAEGRHAAAAAELRELLVGHATYPDLHALLGLAEMGLGTFDDAVASFGRALELNPEYHAARLDLARSLESLGLRGQALDHVALVLEVEPEHAQARDLQARWNVRGRSGAERGFPSSHRP